MSEPEAPEMREIVTRVREALAPHGDVAFAYLFGSRAEGGASHGVSDVDVAVFLREGGDREEGPRTWARLHGELVRALARAHPGVGLRQPAHAPEGVDLVILNDAPPLLADRVIRGGELAFSRSESERLRWVVRTKSRYCDLRPLRRRLDAAVSERLRSGRFGRSSGGRDRGGEAGGAGSAKGRESGEGGR